MKRLITLALAAVVGSGVTLVAVTPAQASLSTCSFNYVCLWDGRGYQTGTFLGQWQKPRGTCFNLPTLANDKASSFYNHMDPDIGRHVQFYKDANCTGTLLLADAPANRDWWGGPFPAGYFNNFVPSFKAPGEYENVATSIWFNNG